MRFKILTSTIPLILAALFARGELSSAAQPCITLGETSVQIAPFPFPFSSGSALSVSFTSDPARATVRVQIVDAPEAADFAVVDDVASAEADACEVSAATQFVAIAASASRSASTAQPVIYLSRDGNADYRIYVRSKHFTPREAAALVVGARGGHTPMTAAAS